MESLDNLLTKISWEKKINEQLDVLTLFDNITPEQIDELTSGKYIKSTEAGIVIRYLGYEKLRHKLPELLVHLQDCNWPAAGYVAYTLIPSGELLIPHIKDVFIKHKDDVGWLYWIISQIILQWDAKLISQLKNELIEVVKNGDLESAAYYALMALKSILNKEEFISFANFLLVKFRQSEHLQFEIEELQEAILSFN